jgi:hypothetical protein
MRHILAFHTSPKMSTLSDQSGSALGLDSMVEFVTVTGAYTQWGIE